MNKKLTKVGDYVSIEHDLFEGRGTVMEIFYGEIIPIQVELDSGQVVRVVNDDIAQVIKEG